VRTVKSWSFYTDVRYGDKGPGLERFRGSVACVVCHNDDEFDIELPAPEEG
jgi:hypothetical protein